MHLLWIAVLIQTLFFIVSDAHFYVLTFIGLSLILQAFSKNPLVFLLGPMIVVHLLFVYWPIQEGFKFKKAFKKTGKTVKNTANKAKKTTTNTVNSATNDKLDDEPPDHGSPDAVNEEISNPEEGVTVPPPPEPLDIASNTPA